MGYDSVLLENFETWVIFSRLTSFLYGFHGLLIQSSFSGFVFMKSYQIHVHWSSFNWLKKFWNLNFASYLFTETNCLSQLLPSVIFKAPLNYHLHAVWRDQFPFSSICFQYKPIVNQSTLDSIYMGLTAVWSVAPMSLSQILFLEIIIFKYQDIFENIVFLNG